MTHSFFKKESDLDLIKGLQKKLSLIQDDLKIENKTRNIFNIKVSDFKKLKNIKDTIFQSHFLWEKIHVLTNLIPLEPFLLLLL